MTDPKIKFGIIGAVILTIIIAIVLGVTLSGSGSNTGFKIIPGSDITFTEYDRASFEAYTKILNEFIEPYNGLSSSTNNVHCNARHQSYPGKGEVCIFQDTWLGDCNMHSNWGFNDLKPCILVTYEKDLEFIPDAYDTYDELPENMPKDLKDAIKRAEYDDGLLPDMMWVYCEHGYGYTPWQAFPTVYFPNNEIPNYLPPVVAVTFDLSNTSKVEVQCSIWSKNKMQKSTTFSITKNTQK